MAEYSKELLAFNDETVRLLAPAIAYVVILLVLGTLGNPLVVYIYGFRLKMSTSHIFITALAVSDLIVCTMSMPLEIVDLVRFYTFESVAACKIFRVVNHLASISSALILIVIAIDRYKKICKPLKSQITLRQAQICVCVVVVTALFLSLPNLIFYDIVSINITSYNNSLEGFDCTTNRDDAYRLYITIYNSFLFLAFVILVIVLFVMYSLVGMKIYRMRKSRVSIKQKRQNDTIHSSSSNKESDKNDTFQISNLEKCNSRKEKYSQKESEIFPEIRDKTSELETDDEIIDTDRTTTTSTQMHMNSSRETKIKTKNTKKLRLKSKNGRSITTQKYTTVMLSITILYILSFLPYLIIMVIRAFSKDVEHNSLSDVQLVVYNVFVRSYFVNSAFNPIIYGFLNRDFRNLLLSRIHCRS